MVGNTFHPMKTLKKPFGSRLSTEAIALLEKKAKQARRPVSRALEAAIAAWEPVSVPAIREDIGELIKSAETLVDVLRASEGRESVHTVSEPSASAPQIVLQASEGIITPSDKENAMAGEIERLRAENARLLEQLNTQWDE
jgi:hypothetical protein